MWAKLVETNEPGDGWIMMAIDPRPNPVLLGHPVMRRAPGPPPGKEPTSVDITSMGEIDIIEDCPVPLHKW